MAHLFRRLLSAIKLGDSLVSQGLVMSALLYQPSMTTACFQVGIGHPQLQLRGEVGQLGAGGEVLAASGSEGLEPKPRHQQHPHLQRRPGGRTGSGFLGFGEEPGFGDSLKGHLSGIFLKLERVRLMFSIAPETRWSWFQLCKTAHGVLHEIPMFLGVLIIVICPDD